jgi:hypothetical protein
MDKNTRQKILNEIMSDLQMATQWVANSPDRHTHYMSQAEALVELLEVEDCGATGGFDKKNPRVPHPHAVFSRFLTVINKHHRPRDVKSSCGFDVQGLGLFYSALCELRGQVLAGGREAGRPYGRG